MEISNKEKEYHHEPHMVYSCQYHVIFCPKYRRNVLKDGIDVRLKELILEKQDEYQYKILEMEVMPDHVHLLIDINPRLGVYHVINQVKGYSSSVLRSKFSCSQVQDSNTVDTFQIHIYRWVCNIRKCTKIHRGSEVKIILTYNIRHNRNFSSEVIRAWIPSLK